MGPIAGVNQVGVTVDEARRDPASLAIDDLERIQVRRRALGGTRVRDEPVAAGDETVVDDSEAIAAGRHRGEAGISPDPVTTHAGNI